MIILFQNLTVTFSLENFNKFSKILKKKRKKSTFWIIIQILIFFFEIFTTTFPTVSHFFGIFSN